MNLGCVVMASGQGRRFGSNKLMADVLGTPLVLATALSVSPIYDVVVSTRWTDVEDLCRSNGIACARHEGTVRSQSVRAGLTYGTGRGWDGCLFLPGDQPCVTTASFNSLAREFESAGSDRVVRAACDGVAASPVLFPRRLFEGLLQLQGKSGGAPIIADEAAAGRPAVLVEVAAAELQDVDTRDDQQKVVAYLSRLD